MSALTDIAADFITAETDAEQAKVLEANSVGRIRKGLRQLALRLERAEEQGLADEVWAIRESLTAEVQREEVVHFEPELPEEQTWSAAA